MYNVEYTLISLSSKCIFYFLCQSTASVICKQPKRSEDAFALKEKKHLLSLFFKKKSKTMLHDWKFISESFYGIFYTKVTHQGMIIIHVGT